MWFGKVVVYSYSTSCNYFHNLDAVRNRAEYHLDSTDGVADPGTLAHLIFLSPHINLAYILVFTLS